MFVFLSCLCRSEPHVQPGWTRQRHLQLSPPERDLHGEDCLWDRRSCRRYGNQGNSQVSYISQTLMIKASIIKLSYTLLGSIADIVKILNLYIILSCSHLYHFFPVSIHSMQCIHCLLQLCYKIFNMHCNCSYQICTHCYYQ